MAHDCMRTIADGVREVSDVHGIVSNDTNQRTDQLLRSVVFLVSFCDDHGDWQQHGSVFGGLV